MADKISVNDLIQFDGAENIEVVENCNEEERLHEVLSKKLSDDLKSMSKKKQKQRVRKHTDFFSVVPKTDLERHIDMVLNKKDIEDIATARARKSFKHEFDTKMARIKRIKSKAYRRARRVAKRKAEAEALLNENPVNNHDDCGEAEVTESYKSIPDNLLKTIGNVEEEEQLESNTPVFSFAGPENVVEDKQKNLVNMAFNLNEEEDENTAEFIKEKMDIVNEEAPKINEVVLPGWGSWAGVGLDVVKTKVNTVVTEVEGIKYSNRMDFNKSHVIINEKAIELNKKYMATLPYGYTKEDYQNQINNSISKEWNTVRIFKKLVKSKEKPTKGSVIEPVTFDLENDP